MLKVGDIAPKFILPDQKGSEFSLTEKLRDGALILFFYPADFTPGCTKEVCAIRDIHEEILSVGMQVVGVSPQNRASHSRFSDEYDLPYTLICDPDKVAIKMYDADGPMGFGVRRVTYRSAKSSGSRPLSVPTYESTNMRNLSTRRSC